MLFENTRPFERDSHCCTIHVARQSEANVSPFTFYAKCLRKWALLKAPNLEKVQLLKVFLSLHSPKKFVEIFEQR